MKKERLPLPYSVILLLALPGLEVTLLRRLINANMSVGAEPATFIAPGFVCVLLFFKWNSEKRMILNRSNKWLLALHLILLVAFCRVTVKLPQPPSEIDVLRWTLLAGSVFFSAFFSVVDIRELWTRALQETKDWKPAFLAATAFIPMQLFGELIWNRVSPLFSKILFVCRSLPGLSQLRVHPHSAGPLLILPWGNLHILFGCGGFEGISLFLFFWGLILLFDGELLSSLQSWTVALLGILYMFVLNIVRILSLVYIGNRKFSQTHDSGFTQSIISIFHSDYAWGVYVLGLFLFFSIFYVVCFSKNRYVQESHNLTVHK